MRTSFKAASSNGSWQLAVEATTPLHFDADGVQTRQQRAAVLQHMACDTCLQGNFTAAPERPLHPCSAHAVHNVGCQPEWHALRCREEQALLKGNAQVNVDHLHNTRDGEGGGHNTGSRTHTKTQEGGFGTFGARVVNGFGHILCCLSYVGMCYICWSTRAAATLTSLAARCRCCNTLTRMQHKRAMPCRAERGKSSAASAKEQFDLRGTSTAFA